MHLSFSLLNKRDSNGSLVFLVPCGCGEGQGDNVSHGLRKELDTQEDSVIISHDKVLKGALSLLSLYLSASTQKPTGD